MRIDLQPRARAPRWLGLAAPIVAFVAALLIGGLVVAIMGRSPIEAFHVYFLDPLSEGWSLQEIAVKASPLVHDGDRPVLLLPGQPVEHRRRGAVHRRRGARRLARPSSPMTAPCRARSACSWILPAMLLLGAPRRRRGRHDPGAAARVARRIRDPHQPDAGLCVPARPRLSGARTHGATREGFNFPVTVTFDPGGYAAGADRGRAPARRRADHSPRRARRRHRVRAHAVRLRDPGRRRRPAGRSLRRLQRQGRLTLAVFAISGALAGLAGDHARSRARSGSCSPPSRRATASRPSSWPSWGACRPGGSWLPGSSWR